MDRLAGTITSQGEEMVTPISLDDPKPIDDQAAEPGPPTANIVSAFKPDEIKKIASRCLEDYEDDVKSREPHMKMLRRWYELYAGITKIKNWPFQNAANVKIPLLTWTILQLSGRLTDAMVPAKGDIYHSIPTRSTDPDEVDRAMRTELYLNWYLRDKVPDFKASYAATIWQVVAFGDCFRGAYWDYTENKLCLEWIPIEDMVVPYAQKCTDPRMKGLSRYTRVRHLSLFEIQDRGDSGEFDPKVANSLKPGDGTKSKPKSELSETIDEVDGKEPPTSQRFLEDEERQVLEQHRWLRLPKDPTRNPAFDGKAHPVKITIDEASEKVLSVMLREEDDPADARRFVKEQAVYDQTVQANQAFQQANGMTVDPQSGQQVPMPQPPPVPPSGPKPVRQREVFFFTHWGGFEGEGFYKLGMGHFNGPINEAMNTLFNQQIDRSTVNNAGGGIISRQMRFQRGPIDRQPGKYVEVDAPASAIKDGLQNWPMVPPDPDGRWFVQELETWAGRTSGAGDTLSGEPVGTNETARAAMSRTEQAQKQISVLASDLITYMTCDARLAWQIFSVHLDEEEYVDVVDSKDHPRQIKISRDDFKSDAKVVPTADARMSSKAQRVSDAMDAFNFALGPTAPPEIAQNPIARRAIIDTVLMAMDLHEVVEILGPPPPPPPPPQPVPQWQENAGFLQDHDQQTNPQDDDDAHLLEIQNFKQDPLGYAKLSPTGRKMIDNHERGHLAQKLVKERKAHEQQQQALQGPPGGGPPGLAQHPANGAPGGVPPS